MEGLALLLDENDWNISQTVTEFRPVSLFVVI
jgi:hypothetical protein